MLANLPPTLRRTGRPQVKFVALWKYVSFWNDSKTDIINCAVTFNVNIRHFVLVFEKYLYDTLDLTHQEQTGIWLYNFDILYTFTENL